MMESGEDGGWLPWNIDFPDHPGIPGQSNQEPFAWDVLVAVLEFIEQWFRQHDWRGETSQQLQETEPLKRFWEMATEAGATIGEAALETTLAAAVALTKRRRPNPDDRGRAQLEEHHHQHLNLTADMLGDVRSWVWHVVEGRISSHPELCRFWNGIDIAMTSVIGAIRDGVFRHGLATIDEWDFVAWLERHGISASARYSTPIRALYDCFFGFRDGHVEPTADNLCLAAGAGLGCALRIGFTYNGAMLYLMNAGMGDVVVAPIYQVLEQRGVKFQFFHRVTAIEADAAGTRVERVRIAVQATPKEGPYQPLLSVGGLACWPSEPDFEQLREGEQLRDRGINLESRWADWADPGEIVLEAGHDFDQIVLGIALSGLGEICSDLAAKRSEWREMIDKIPSMQTFGVQLWLNKDLEELGCQGPPRSAVAAPETLDVWADMSHTIQREDYGLDSPPRGILYLCGPLAGDLLQRPPSDHNVPAEAQALVLQEARDWLARYAGWIWPKCGDSANPLAMSLSNLFAPGAQNDEERLMAQFFRANIDPTERYVLSPPVWNKLRLPPDGSGFEGLFLAGDWTQTPINAGCVEAATMSGMACSRAICGWPERIWGEYFMVE